MPVRDLSSFLPTAEELLALDLPRLGEILLLHLDSWKGEGKVWQPVGGLNRGYFVQVMEGTERGLGPPRRKQPEYGARQPEVTLRMLEAWSWLEKRVLLRHNSDQPHPDWFLITTEGTELLSRLRSVEHLEMLGAHQDKADLEQTGGPKVVAAGLGVGQSSDIFLSYAREDLPRVKPLVEALEKRGWSVWWDRTIKPGQIFERVIEAALANARCLVVCWSRDSVQSNWVRKEAAEGERREILIPALLDDVVIPLAFRDIQAANLVGWRGELPHAGFEDLARSVEGILGTPSARRAASVAAPMATTVIKPAGARLVRGQARFNPKDELTYVWIPPGKFIMGCSPGDSDCESDEQPAHEVTITKGFWMGQTPVTQESYQRVIRKDPSQFKGPRLPVDTVSWNDAQAYCEAIGMRLPSEAEWEYAARAGSTDARYGNLDEIAWYGGNSGGKTHEAAQKLPNGFGLYDMLGDVWEWVADWFDAKYYGQSPGADPLGPAGGEYRVLRGGSWNNLDPWNVRASHRLRYEPTYRVNYIGFRCAGELP